MVTWGLRAGLIAGCGSGLDPGSLDASWMPPEPDNFDRAMDAGTVGDSGSAAPESGRPTESLRCGMAAPFTPIGTGRGEGPLSAEALGAIARSVGVMQWRGDLPTPNSVAGRRFCTVTLISEDLALTAGHCLSPDAKGQVFPPGVNVPDDLCRFVEVDFEHQQSSVDGGARGQRYPCERVVAYRYDGPAQPSNDWAVVRLGGSPGRRYGWASLGQDPTEDRPGVLVGHPQGGEKIAASGRVVHTTKHAIFDLIPSLVGMSGSALWTLPPDGVGPPRISGIRVRGAEGGCARDPGATFDDDALRYTNLAVPISYILEEVPLLRDLASPPAPAPCAEPTRRCDAACVDVRSDAAHCGACGVTCSGSQQCLGGRCVATCDPQRGDRCGDRCVDLQTDPSNCGACGRPCAATTTTAARCLRGACERSCFAGRGDCNRSDADGCETSLTSNAQHCGACNHTCALLNATAACVAGTCRVATCAARFADCNARSSDGCETSLGTDPRNCGACGSACAAGRRCADGRCR